jgi:hypothetical protein
MASLVHLQGYQTERRLNTVCLLLGWSAPPHACRIRAGASPLGNLAARGVHHALCLLYLVWVGAADFPLLHVTVGGPRSPATAPHTPFHSSGSHLCSPMRDVRGGGPVHLSLPPFFRTGEVREGQGPSRSVLLPDKGGFSPLLYLFPQRREVGKLAGRMGDRQYRG